MAWTLGGRVVPGAWELVACLGNLDAEGLAPEDYGGHRLGQELHRFEADPSGADAAALDHDLTHAFLLAAWHLSRGKAEPSRFELIHLVHPRSLDLAAVLNTALVGGGMEAALRGLDPALPEYAALRAALPRYRALAASGGWERVAPGPNLGPDRSADSLRVSVLERRLAAEGYLGDVTGDGVYSDRMAEAVGRFQIRHGLEPDGVVGRWTLEAINVPATRRVREIELGMERLRWLPADLGERYVRVNIAAQRLDLFDHGRIDTTLRVIVGRDEWETPVFSDSMRYIVLNPYWNVPDHIAAHTILTKVLEDSTYLKSGDYEVFSGTGREAAMVDPASVDWASFAGSEEIPYRIRQKPGPQNALGRMKFMFPNRFNVYLHDTSDPRLFRKQDRQLSHGCIRVESPLTLARFLFADAWDPERFERASRSKGEKTLRLPHTVPIHLVYWTATADDQGVSFFADAYGADAELDRVLHTGKYGTHPAGSSGPRTLAPR